MNEIKLAGRLIRVYHCMDCTGFIESEQIEEKAGKSKRKNKKRFIQGSKQRIGFYGG